MPRPVIGITMDNGVSTGGAARYESAAAYSQAVADAGGTPVLLPQRGELIPNYLRLCAGVLFTGGDDVDMQPFGGVNHPQVRLLHPARQIFEFALLQALEGAPAKPVLGICLGCQMLALHAGGKLNQHLPDTLGETGAKVHQKNNRHAVAILVNDCPAFPANPQSAGADPQSLPSVISSHHQAVCDPGRLRLVAAAADGVIEAVDDPAKPFYVGVQWHPERGGADSFHRDLIARLVAAAERLTTDGPR